MLPTFWFRNTWARPDGDDAPILRQIDAARQLHRREHASSASDSSTCEDPPELLFTENETNTQRIANAPNRRHT